MVNHKGKIIFNLALSFGVLLLGLRFTCLAQDKIVAIVNNDIITQKDLNDFLTFMRVDLSANYSGQQLEERIGSLKSDIINKLIDDRLILQEAKKSKIDIDKNRVRAKIEEIRKRYDSDREFQDSLSKEGLVQADLESRIKEQLLMRAVIDLKIRSSVRVNPSEVTEFYNRNSEEFKLAEGREFESLNLDDRDSAFKIYHDLRAHADMADLAQRYLANVDRITARHGEELRKDIEAIVFKLNVGQVSEPVKIENSYYIFRLISKIPPKQQPLSEVQDKIYAYLFDRKMQEKLGKWLDELKERSYVKIMQD